MERHLRARRLARLACVACAAAPAPLYAAADGDAETKHPIVVVGPHDETPATSESVPIERLRETTAVINTEDSVRYLPSLMVRKRHVGDTQAPLATRTSGVGSSARSLIYVDGVLISSLFGNNNSTASPRWGMVAPEEIDRVDVLYGPFSAACPGNSIGAVVNIATRLPERTEATLSAATSVQRFSQYGTEGTYPAYQLAGSGGTKVGPLTIFASANHVASRSQPLAYVTVARPSAASAAGTPVAGAFADLNRTGQPIFVLGAGGFEHQIQDNLKLKLVAELSPGLRLSYMGGLFLNDTAAKAETYLGGPSFAGTLNLDGRRVDVPASAFSNNVYRLDERHWLHALTAEGVAAGVQWRAIASRYRFDKDSQRIPSVALPAALSGRAGSIVDLSGTGWTTLDADAAWRGTRAGVHWDDVELQNHRFATADWLRGPPGALAQAAEGRTRTAAAWAEQKFSFGAGLGLTLGGRYEQWRAGRGFNFSASPALSVRQPELSRHGFSPKASLRWEGARGWSATLSAAQAYRFPTVQELYQAVATGPTISVPNPNLAPERARSAELAVEHRGGGGRVRLSLFHEEIRDALISQTAPLIAGSATLFSFVQNIPKDRTNGLELAFERTGLIGGRLGLVGSLTLVAPRIVSDPAFLAAQGKDIPQVPRRRATLVATWRQSDSTSFVVAGRYASRSFATIDNSDPVTHTYQGFEGYMVVDSRVNFRIAPRFDLSLGVENLGNAKYYIFHPFPQRTLTAEVHVRL